MKKILLGAAYYPEQDHPREWQTDAALMREAGLNCVRIGEFAWSRMQRSDGTFTLDWIEEVVDTLAAEGIRTILSTPTATPPAWICDRYPDLPCLSADGKAGLFGGRRHYSVFHEGYRTDCRELVNALGERFGKNEHIIGWQLDNEAGSYFTVDCSPPAHQAFIAWLKQRYRDPDELNRRWGLIFWNQEVERFEQIPPPVEMMATRNPSMLLDYNRFCLEGIASFLLGQAEVLRPHVPRDRFIVACCIELAMGVLVEMQAQMDAPPINAMTVHNYPELQPDPCQTAMHLDCFRMLGAEMPLLVMEQQTGSGHTTTGGLDPQIRRFWAWEAMAAGAKSILWFHWRRFRTGCEWRLTPILERDRKPRATFRSIQALTSEIQALSPLLLEAEVESDTQVLYDRDNQLGFDRSSGPVFWMQIQLPDAPRHRKPMWESAIRNGVYLPLTRLGRMPTFVTFEHEWDTQKPLVAMDLDICTAANVAKLTDFCRQGGTLICFAGAGERDQNGAHHPLPPPGILSELMGVELEDYYPLSAECGTAFDHQHGTDAEPSRGVETTADVKLGSRAIRMDIRHGEILKTLDAEPIGFYEESGPARGGAVVSRRQVGKGSAIYVGAFPASAADGANLFRYLLADCPDTDLLYRQVKMACGTRRFRFLLNGTPSEIPLPSPCHDLIRQERIKALGAYGVALAED